MCRIRDEVGLDGLKDVLVIRQEKTEGARFRPWVITELQKRGVRDILIVCVYGLKGFSEALESVYPKTEVQL